MNILLVKYQYLEAQISGKFVKQKKVGEYLVFSLFSYRQQRPPPLSLSNHYHLLFCKRGLGKPQNFIFRLPNSNSSKLISWQKKTPQKCWDGMQRKLHILQQRWGWSQGGENNCKLGRKSFFGLDDKSVLEKWGLIFWEVPFSQWISIFQRASISSAPLLRLPACSPAHEMYESGGGGREGGGWWGRGEGRVLGGAWAPANSRIYFSLARGRWDNTGKPQGTSPSLHIFIFQSILFGKSSSGKERAAGEESNQRTTENTFL